MAGYQGHRFAILLRVTESYGTWGGTRFTDLCSPPTEMVPDAANDPQFIRAASITCHFCGAEVKIGELKPKRVQARRQQRRLPRMRAFAAMLYEARRKRPAYGMAVVTAGTQPCSHSFATTAVRDDPRINKHEA